MNNRLVLTVSKEHPKNLKSVLKAAINRFSVNKLLLGILFLSSMMTFDLFAQAPVNIVADKSGRYHHLPNRTVNDAISLVNSANTHTAPAGGVEVDFSFGMNNLNNRMGGFGRSPRVTIDMYVNGTHYWRAASTDDHSTSSPNNNTLNGATFVTGGGTFPLGSNSTQNYRNVRVKLPSSVTSVNSLNFTVITGEDDVSFNVNSIMMIPEEISNDCETGDICYEVCSNTPIQLNTGAVSGTYTWTPSAGLSDSSIQNPIATVSDTTIYILEKTTVGSQRLSNPLSGFTTDLIQYGPPLFGLFGGRNMGQARTYVLTQNVGPFHSDLPNCTHPNNLTYLAVNGDTRSGSAVWCKSASFVGGKPHQFSYDYAATSSTAPGNLQVQINGTNVGNPLTITNNCNWQTETVTYNAPASGNFTICIRNSQTAASGNDFAVANMKLTDMEVTREIHKVLIDEKQTNVFATDTTQACIGDNNTIAINYTGSGTVTWTGPNGFTGTGNSISLINPNASDEGLYVVRIEEPDCIYTDETFIVVEECGPDCNAANGSVHGIVFIDQNANGVLDNNEVGLANVRVSEIDDANNIVQSVTTSTNGRYFLGGVAGSNAKIQFDEVPEPYVSSVRGSGNRSSIQFVIVPDCEANYGVIDSDDANFNFFGNRVWLDEDGDGLQDIAEPGIRGLRVFLFDSNNSLIATTVTDAFGDYSLKPIAPLVEGDDYVIVYGNNSDYTNGVYTYEGNDLSVTTPNAGNDLFDSDAIVNTNYNGRPHVEITYSKSVDPDIFDLGFTGETDLSISGKLFIDCNNNGVMDQTEEPLAGASVQLSDGETVTTDSDGNYSITVEEYGNYSIIVDPEVSGLEPAVKSTGSGVRNQINANNTSDVISFTSGNMLVINGGYQDTEGPQFSSTPTDIDLTCASESIPSVTITATDNLEGNVDVAVDTIEKLRTDGFIDTIYHVWTAADECGNQTEARRYINYGGAFQAAIDIDNVICGSTQKMESSIINGTAPFTYTWTGSGSVSFSDASSATPVATFANSGEATVNLTVTDASGCSISLTEVLTVTAGANVSIAGDTSYCAGSTISLVASGSDNYTWSTPSGNTVTGANLTIPNATSADRGTYILEVMDGDCELELRYNITVADTSEVKISPIQTACLGDEVTLNVEGPEADSYSWRGPSGFTSTDRSPSISSTELGAGNYLYQVTATYGACEIAERLTIKIQDPGSIVFPTDRTVCENSNVSISITGASNFLWQGPNGFLASGTSVEFDNVKESDAGTYYITVDDEGSCSKRDSFQLNVVSDNTVDVWASEPNCGTNSFQLFASVPSATYSWVGPNGFTSREQNPIVSNLPAEGGTYRLVLRTKGCEVNKQVVVQPITAGLVTANVVHENCPGDNGLIDLTLSADVTYFKWADLAANTSLDRSGLEAGQYTIVIRTSTCERSVVYNINDLCTVDETKDTDDDGIPDVDDLDDDNDGISDIEEGDGDADNDGIVDRLDLDSDNDGITDLVENGNGLLDDDQDGRVNIKDSNNDGIHDDLAGTPIIDTDNDGKPDSQDLDSDNDGIPDVVEEGFQTGDVNRDGMIDGPDNDGDGKPDAINIQPNTDTDDDGVPNRIDIDSDNDGIIDVIEYLDGSVSIVSGTTDANNNGMSDPLEQLYRNGLNPNNVDNDAAPDYLDNDTDNDGDPDVLEAYDTDNDGTADTVPSGSDSDGDGLDDAFDAVNGRDPFDGGKKASDYPDLDNPGNNPDWRELKIELPNPNNPIDTDMDGIPDLVEGTNDTDGDGIPDYQDLDSDNDGIPDVTEVNGPDANNDGIKDDTDFIAVSPVNSDEDDVPDYLDIDSDNDGILDLVERVPSDEPFQPTDIDNNENGIDDGYEDAGLEAPVDTDNDGVPDYIDLDTDGDNELDVVEGNDFDGNGVPDKMPTGVDTDGDGLDDAFDNTPSRDPANGGEPTATDLPDVDDPTDDEPDFRSSNESNTEDEDSDKDGIADVLEGTDDTDNDGIPDYLDIDSDNDGILDLYEVGGEDTDNDGEIDGGLVSNLPDADNDGYPNHLDIDADNDGILDMVEGLPSDAGYLPTGVDANENGLDDGFETNGFLTPTNTDGEDEPDFLDTNSDNDDRMDLIEGHDTQGNDNPSKTPTGRDGDKDGLDDAFDDNIGFDASNGGEPTASDYPDVKKPGDEPDWREEGEADSLEDTDRDGIPDSVEGNIDTDGDGVVDYLDLDSDNDGIPDVVEVGGVDDNNDGIADDPTFQVTVPRDTDSDNVYDYLDLDSDNDGIPDLHEKLPTGSEVEPTGEDANSNGIDDAFEPIGEPVDTDEDGTPDYLDTDSDNDTIPDNTEAFDEDGDGEPDTLPIDSDQDLDGIDDAYDTDDSERDPTNGTLPVDAVYPDNNVEGGEPDWREPAEDIEDPTDTDGDGIPDDIEGTVDTDDDGVPDFEDLDSDNDGIPDAIEAGGVDEDGDGISDEGIIDEPLDTDEDGIPNHLDIDADNDGIPDFHEKLPTGSNIRPSGNDENGDGIDDAFMPITEALDIDNDGIPDFMDTDSDGDGEPDSIEAFDIDGDGQPERVPSGEDADNDGLDDAFDTDPSQLNPTNGILPSLARWPDLDDPGNEPDWRELNSDFEDDTDGDGIPDSIEGTVDTDDDGIPDSEDLDSDNDGIPDVLEAGGVDEDGDGINDNPDTRITDLPDEDEDGVPNHLDLDTDGDGIPDLHEKLPTGSTVAPSGDDDNDNGIDDAFEDDLSPVDTDEDGTPDYLDTDSDDDGEPDTTEAFDEDGDGEPETVPVGSDDDNDGIDDAFDTDDTIGDPTNGTLPADMEYPDNDMEGGEPDWRANDSDDTNPDDTDGDGIPDDIEGTVDTDDDGIPDFEDLDSDNDGIPDVIEAGGVDEDGDGESDNGAIIEDPLDTDEDGIPNHLDLDTDGDGIPDLHEKFPTGSTVEPSGDDDNDNGIDDAFEDDLTPVDTDEDGTPDFLDLDSDDDGEPDTTEAFDEDGDGEPETVPTGSDDDNDGIDNAFDTDDEARDPTNGTLPVDMEYPDNDEEGGEPDWRSNDSDDNDPDDRDGDGIPDDIEGTVDTDDDGIPDSEDLDSDNDGIPDVIEAGGIDEDNDGLSDEGVIIDEPLDSDEDGIPNHLDIDADGDGIPDFHEKLPTQSPIEPSGEDENENGIDDAFEPITTPVTTNDSGLPDYLNPDSDADGEPDLIEAHDEDGDGEPEVEPSGIDSDNDGLDDAFDRDLSEWSPTNGVLPIDATYPDNDDEGNEPDWRETNSDVVDDSDGDGIPDSIEGTVDTDDDGIPDSEDLDSDNDGIPDVLEVGGTDEDGDGKEDDPAVRIQDLPDADEDGVPNHLDIDADNDGIPDFHEKLPTGEAVNPSGTDANNNGIDDAFEPLDSPEDTDNDGIPDYLDLDSDNDEEPDGIEAFDRDGDGQPEVRPSGVDEDEDGLDDAFDTDDENRDPTNGVLPNVVRWPDNDEEGGEPDWRHNPNSDDAQDSDNDGITDEQEGEDDTDGDGIADKFDIDSDNDGILDLYENGGQDEDGNGEVDTPNPTGEVVDTDNDGIPNYLDLDTDNDGILDYIEGLPSDEDFKPTGEDTNENGLDDGFEVDGYPTPENTDTDEMPDFIDTDSDEDGVPDLVEGHDEDGDKMPETQRSGSDEDGDGLDDAFDEVDGFDPYNGGEPKASDYPDVVSPGNEPDWRDPVDGNDNDNDGVPDDEDLDDDNDGIPDTIETTTDTDGDGIPNHLDIDSDNDGILDVEEIGLGDTNGNNLVDEFVDENGDGLRDDVDFSLLTGADKDGDGIPNFLDIDADNDGILDVIESKDSDANIEPLGSDMDNDGLDDRFDNQGEQEYTFPQDTDGDEEPDYLDLDSDDDGMSDITEAYDTDNNGIIDLAPEGVDSDNDGYDDAYDNLEGFHPADDMSRTARTYPDLDNPGNEPDWREVGEDIAGNSDTKKVTTTKNTTVEIDVENPEDMDEVRVERQPSRGVLEYDETEKVYRYTPVEDECDYLDTLVYVIERGGTVDSVEVEVRVRCSKIEVFTGLTPNNDGINDGLKIAGIEDYPENTVIIFNRYGHEVYSIRGYDNTSPWEGTFQDNGRLPEGTYFYVIVLEDEEGSTYSGYIQLMR